MKNNKHLSVDSGQYTHAYFMHAGGGSEYLNNELGEIYARVMGMVENLVKDTDKKVILDVGCGRAELLKEYAKNGNICYGVDYAEAAIQIAHKTMDDLPEEKRKNVYLKRMDLKEIDFKDSMFDAVFMLDVVEHLYPWELDIIIPKIYTMLKTGGVFIIHTYPTKWLNDCVYAAMGLLGIRPTSKHVHPNVQTVFSTKKMLNNCFSNHINVWCEKRPRFWNQNLSADYNIIIKKIAYLLDYIYDNPFFSKVLMLPLLRHFFSTDIWAVALKK
jgi:cyclopropane fatty-acyl-phospholipid synthase-like methyltransferase